VGSLTVRVMPRPGGTGVEASTTGIVVRVRTAPEGGRAAEEARLQHSAYLLPGVTLRRGRRSREKVFELAGMTEDQALQRLRG
jgi:uncharacterized protein YggU (UPF0235/DUF167 family)